MVSVTKGGIQLNKDNVKRQLNNIWKEVNKIDAEVYGNKTNHTNAIVGLSEEIRKLVMVVNEVVDEVCKKEEVE